MYSYEYNIDDRAISRHLRFEACRCAQIEDERAAVIASGHEEIRVQRVGHYSVHRSLVQIHVD